MNDSNAKTMYETVPAAAELNKVPGFDPLNSSAAPRTP